jgi:hypothetical protein
MLAPSLTTLRVRSWNFSMISMTGDGGYDFTWPLAIPQVATAGVPYYLSKSLLA